MRYEDESELLGRLFSSEVIRRDKTKKKKPKTKKKKKQTKKKKKTKKKRKKHKKKKHNKKNTAPTCNDETRNETRRRFRTERKTLFLRRDSP